MSLKDTIDEYRQILNNPEIDDDEKNEAIINKYIQEEMEYEIKQKKLLERNLKSKLGINIDSIQIFRMLNN